jgi:CRISPR-associated endonuclease/helicase Cas3
MQGVIHMNKLEFVNINELFENLSSIHAHTDENKPSERLEEHLSETRKFLEALFDKKGIEVIVDNIISGLSCDGKIISKELCSLIKKMFINAIYLHDTGKINPAFQKIKMKNKLYKDVAFSDSEHSLLSALIYIDIFEPEIKGISDKSLKYYMYNILYSFAYNISRHHTYLADTYDFIDKLLQKKEAKYYKDYKSSTILNIKLGDNCPFNYRSDSYKHWKIDGLGFYILNRLQFALIVGCDYYATYSYKTGNGVDFGTINDIDAILSLYKDYKVYKGIDAYRNDKNYFSDTPINALRSDLFLEAEQTLLENLDQNIFYLEAPTGGGKTNISINIALNIVKNLPQYNKVFYIFPFNTLVEQTKNTFQDIFAGKLDFAVINSITPIITKEEHSSNNSDNNINYDKSYLDRQFLHYPVILTTHVNFFNYLFGVGREVCFPLIHLCNSIVILDEIQSYRNSIWTEIIMFLSKYAKLLNIKIVIMSATLPKLHTLLREGYKDVKIINLIKDKNKYFQNPLFKDRVKLDFSMLREEMTLEKLAQRLSHILKQHMKPAKVLIEFIKKDTARDFYNMIKDQFPLVIELSGDDNKCFRDQAIKKIDSSKEIIVVATQVIEAGVNIDMDIGLKDISILDSEEQFLGRINRSCLKNYCIAYFFYLDKTENVYRDDFRTGQDLRDSKYQQMLESKNFDEFYLGCLKEISESKEELNKNNINVFLEEAMKLDYKTIQGKMQLIRQKNFQLYIPYILKVNDKYIDGQEVWNEYKELYYDNRKTYTKKQIDLSIIREKMLYFTFNLVSFDFKTSEPPYYKEELGGYYYLGNEKQYITEDGKFNRRKYLKDTGGPFL